MNTLDATISMLRALPESDIKIIHDITYFIYTKRHNPSKPITKEQILNDLAISREQIANGEYQDLDKAIDEIETKYGIC